MVFRSVQVFIVFFLLFALSFLSWHFLLSIYEVKYIITPPEKKMNVSSVGNIKCVGLNSLGWEIKFRDMDCSFIINEGESLIKILNVDDNNSLSFKILHPGNLEILAKSKFSFGDSVFKFTLVD